MIAQQSPERECDGCRVVLERDRGALAEADAAEWEARRAVIEKQAEEARREKQRRRAQAEVERRSQVRPSHCARSAGYPAFCMPCPLQTLWRAANFTVVQLR